MYCLPQLRLLHVHDGGRDHNYSVPRVSDGAHGGRDYSRSAPRVRDGARGGCGRSRSAHHARDYDDKAHQLILWIYVPENLTFS